MTEPPYGAGPPPYQGGPPPRGNLGGLLAMAFVGVIVFVFIDICAFVLALSGGSEPFDVGGGGPALAVGLAFVAFGGGGALCFVRSPLVRGLGIGLMIGWALVSIVTGGICTGLTL